MKVVSFDVGHTNLAMVVAMVDVDEELMEVDNIEVVHAQMTNLATIKCDDKENCMFSEGDNYHAHKVHHYIESIHNHLKDSDKVLIEKQPICSGLTGVEQSLYIYIKQRYSNGVKNHVRFVQPVSIHAHFKMSHQKVERRVEVVELTQKYLTNLPAFKRAKEKDHLGDSCIFVLYYIQVILPQELIRKRPNPFDNFKYVQ
jgi:hypothetical protein